MRGQVPRKTANPQQLLPAQRAAVREIRVAEVTFRRPEDSGATAPPLCLRVLLATETAPPEGVAPIRWVRLTTLPVPDLATAVQIVGYYARRWLIERLHFTLQSGLRAERLRIDDARSLGHALALYYGWAYRGLFLTDVARADPERPATEVLGADERTVLAAESGRAVVTLAEAVREIARWGGDEWDRKAPPPGVKALWLGWRHLTGMVKGWRLAHAQSSFGSMIRD